jgi:CheY-like chemotaxis protein
MTRTVLVADDSISIHDSVQEALAEFDVALEVVYDGEEAASFIEAEPLDLVIADVHMPGKDGYEVATLAKETRSDLPVILLCGTFESFDSGAFESSRADACLKKPFVAADLIEQVTEILGPLAATAVVAEDGVGADVEAVAAEPKVEVEEEPETATEEPPAAAPEGAAEEEPASEEAQASDAGPDDEEALTPTEEQSTVEELAAVAEEEAADEETPAENADLAVEMVDGVGSAVEAPAAVVDRLSDEDIDRVARRVVELAGDGVLREIAWEVVPDLAEVIVRERLDKLESELEEQS